MWAEDYPEDADIDGFKMAAALKEKILAEDFTFEFVAEKFSACSSGASGGDVGTFGRGTMVPEFDAAVFDIDKTEPTPLGTILGPIKTVFGHHLIKVVERDGYNAE